MDNENNKQNINDAGHATKEDMAKMIAANLNSKEFMYDDDDDYSENAGGVKTKSRPKPQQRPRPQNASAKPKKRKKKKSNRSAAFWGAFLAVAIVALGGYYLIGMNNYRGTFLANTYINNVDVSGKTEQEAYKLLSENNANPDNIVIEKLNGKTTIKLKDLGYIDDTSSRISQYFSQQNHYLWFTARFKKTEFNWTADFNYKKDKLEKFLSEKIVNDKEVVKPKNAKLIENDDGTYTVTKETSGTAVDPSKAKVLSDYVNKQIEKGNYKIDIGDIDIYRKASVTAKKLQPTCDKLNKLSTMEINFDFTYAQEKLNSNTIKSWVTITPDGKTFDVDEDKAMKFVEKMAKKYDTYGKARKFKSTKRGVITVPKGEGCYGWWIDQEKTKDLIVKMIKQCKSDVVKPVYFVNPDSQYSYTCNEKWRTKGKDYGNTYVEVDLSAQYLWFYKNGKKVMETPIVSGYLYDSGRKTPPGVYKLWIKELSKTLVGTGGYSYSSFVNYWNNISTIGVGLHDASWQGGNFNSSKVKSSTWASHGCINMPYEKAQYVYNNVPYGTPIFMYY